MKPIALTLALALAPTSSLAAQDWPNWRGPRYDGSASMEGLPAKLDPDGAAWRSELPGPGAATPIVIGERIFLTAVEPEGGVLLAIALDRTSGEVLWDRSVSSGYRHANGAGNATQLHSRSNYASPSAVADETRVYFLFGNGDFAAFTFDGEPVWQRNLQADLGAFAFQWTFSASPTLHGGKLYLPILQRDEPANGLGVKGAESFLLAIDPATGETLFRTVRPSDAVKESRESYATCVPVSRPDGRDELLVIGGDVITGHDPSNGKELWRWGTWNQGHREQWWRLVPTPVVGAGAVLACAPKGAPVFALDLERLRSGAEEPLRWRSEGRRTPLTTDVPTPLFYAESFYVLSDLRESLSKVDPATGEAQWTLALPGRHRWRASPTGVDGKIYLLNHNGLAVVVDAESGEVLSENALAGEDEDGIRASIVAAHGALFVRTNTELFCFRAAEK